jgi:large repetitive protein
MSAPTPPQFATIGSSAGIGGIDMVVSSQDGDSVVNGTADPGSTVSLSFSSQLLAPGIAVVDGSGNWSYALSAADIIAIGQGTDKVITAIATADGTPSASTSSASFSLDTLAPFVAIDTVGGGDSVVSSQPGDDLVTGAELPSNPADDPASIITLKFDATVLDSATIDVNNGTWTYLLTGPNLNTIGQGPGKTITAIATDAAGNTSSVPATLSVDTTPPAAPTISTILPDSGTVGDHITNATALTVDGTAEANATVTVFDGAGQLGRTQPPTAPAHGASSPARWCRAAKDSPPREPTPPAIPAPPLPPSWKPSTPRHQP